MGSFLHHFIDVSDALYVHFIYMASASPLGVALEGLFPLASNLYVNRHIFIEDLCFPSGVSQQYEALIE